MVASLESFVIDNGLTLLDTAAAFVWITSGEPTSALANGWTAGTSGTSLLGYKNFGAGTVFGAPAGTSSRTVSSLAVSDGTITTGGTAAWWAVGVSGTMHAHGSLSATQVVSAGNTFTLASFNIIIPNQ